MVHDQVLEDSRDTCLGTWMLYLQCPRPVRPNLTVGCGLHEPGLAWILFFANKKAWHLLRRDQPRYESAVTPFGHLSVAVLVKRRAVECTTEVLMQ